MDLRHLERWLAEQMYAQDAVLLLERFRATGDQDAFTVLFLRHAPVVQAVCRAVAGNTTLAEDALQETFITLFLTKRAFAVDQELERWLKGTARRIAQRRAAQARRQTERERKAQPPAQVETLWPFDRELVREAIATLPEHYRTVLELRFLENFTPQEIAQRLGGIPEQTVWSRLYRGLDRLRPRLERLGFAPAMLTAVSLSVLPGVSTEVAAATLEGVRAALQDGRGLHWIPGRWLVMTGVVVLGLLGATAAVFWPQTAPSVKPLAMHSQRVESLQERNLRLFEAEVRPALLAVMEPYLSPFEGRIDWVRAEGSEVHVLFAGTRVIPPLRKPPRLLLRYCMLTREIKLDLDDPWTGKWREINPDRAVILSYGRFDLFRMPFQELGKVEQAFAGLPADPRAADEFLRRRLAAIQPLRTDLTVPFDRTTPGTNAIAGNQHALLVQLNGAVLMLGGVSGEVNWHYYCTSPGIRLAVNDAALFTIGKGRTQRRSLAEADASWHAIGDDPPQWGWDDLAATNDLLFSAHHKGRLRVRSASPEVEDWTDAGRLPAQFDHVNCLCGAGDRLFAFTPAGLFSRPSTRDDVPWQLEGRLPPETSRVVRWRDQLLCWSSTQWFERPVAGGEWRVGGSARVASCPRWPIPETVVQDDPPPASP